MTSQNENYSLAMMSAELKGNCVEFVNKSLKDDFFRSPFGLELTRDGKFCPDEEILIRQLDNYILFGETLRGQKVLDKIISDVGLSMGEKIILEDWKKSAFASIFEIKESLPDRVRAMDVLAEMDYEIRFNDPQKVSDNLKKMPVGSFTQTNIMPVKGVWFFSGLQILLPKESEKFIFEDYVKNASASHVFRNNPEKLRESLKIQKDHYRIFVDMFGSNELVLPPKRAQEKLKEYYDKFSSAAGGSSGITMELPEHFWQAETVGIVMDEYEGHHEFFDYGQFVRAFELGDVSDGAREIVMGYLKDSGVPVFVFRRMKDRYPENFRKIISKITTFKNGADPADNFDWLMDELKPGWRENYPSIIPVNKRFEKYYYNLGRNDICYCGSGKKFKKCHGR